MLKKRIIPCLDIDNGKAVKGVHFLNIQNVGDPILLTKKYIQEGADELVFLDITATKEKRKTLLNLVAKVAAQINVPFTVGGGIRSVEDIHLILDAGADKVSLNSYAVAHPCFINEASAQFGSQCIVVAIDAKWETNKWMVTTHGGSKITEWTVIDWAKEVERRGGGELLLTSMENDGVQNGFACELLQDVASVVNIPVIASGGAGTKEHFRDVFLKTGATGALAASVFHYDKISIPSLKTYLSENNIAVR